MKLSQDKVWVKNKFGRVFKPEFIYVFPSPEEDGWYIDGKKADAIESKVLNSTLQEKVAGELTVDAFVDKIINRPLGASPVRLPKMTKGQTTALEGMGTTFIKSDNEWEIAGYGLSAKTLSFLSGTVFTVSSGIIQPLMTGTLYSVVLSKDGKWVIFTENQEYFICGTMEAQ